MLKEIIWIGAGSAIGGISRFALGKWMSHILPLSFPTGTFVINITGSFLIGLFLALQEKNALSASALLFLTTGFCGGFTTFSTFSYEGFSLLKQGNTIIGFLYMAASLLMGLAAVYLGYKITSN